MKKRSRAIPYLLLLLVSALAYLPFIGRFTYANDDWYLMYGAHARGADYFAPAFERDRPMRAYVLGPAYELFGDDPLPYHVSAYVFRLLGAVSLFWLLNQVWPSSSKRKSGANGKANLQSTNYQLPVTNLLIALLFLLYPGFLSQPNPIDYQSQIVSLCAAMTSLALTAAALKTPKTALKIAYTVLSFLLAWIYLGLIEYYLGLEVLRLLVIFLLVRREANLQSPISNPQLRNTKRSTRNPYLVSRIPYLLTRAFIIAIPFLLGPLTFLVWRLFFFTSERAATDAGLQLGALLASPLQTGLWWLARFIQDTINVTFLAWGVPLYHLAFNLRLSDTWIGFALAFAAATGVIFILTRAQESESSTFGSDQPSPEVELQESQDDWRGEMLWVGLVSAAAGLIPVILANRHVEFFSLSRYSLASSVGAAMALVAMLNYLSSARLRWGLVGLLVGLAVLTHYANAVNLAREADAVKNFWQQVSWRVPQIKDGTTLAVQFPASISEDYIVWGPANLIYNPEPQTSQPVEAPIGAVILTPENVTRILAGKGMDEPNRRNIHVVMDLSNVLVIAQADAGGCVRVMDGTQPELSARDDPRVMLIASKSKIQNVDADGSHPAPLEAVFGREPARGWCWYYEQAALARQRGEWERVAALGDEALGLGFYPSDSVEWFPFMQAYAALGREKDLKKLAPILGADAFLKRQACAILTRMADQKMLTPETASSAQEWYCGK